MRVLTIALGSLVLAGGVPAHAQTVDVPIWSNGILGQQALSNTYDNYNRSVGIDDEERSTRSQSCSAETLPDADRRRMETEYVRRVRTDGKVSADAWVHEQGRRFHETLVARGDCPDSRDR